MFANTRVIALLGGCIVALLILTGCQPGFSTPETAELTVLVPEVIGETVVVVETVGAAQPTFEQPPAEQVVEQSTEVATASPTEEVVDQPTEVATISPTDTPEPVTTYLGDVVEVGGILISATNVYDPAELENYAQPEEGKKLVAIDAIIGLTSLGRAIVSANFYLNDNEDYFYYPEEPLDREFGDATKFRFNHSHALIFAGEKVRWLVVFKIPENAIPTKLNYVHEKWWHTNKKLSIGLGAPPGGYQTTSEILNIPPEEPMTKLGDTSSNFDYSMSAQGVEDPAEPDEFRTLNAGEKLVAVDVIFEYESDPTRGISLWRFYLVDNSGYLYTPDVSNVDDPIFNGKVVLVPGKKVRFWVTFRIPEEASPYILKYERGIWLPQDYLETGLIE